jgi:hypothetical protein
VSDIGEHLRKLRLSTQDLSQQAYHSEGEIAFLQQALKHLTNLWPQLNQYQIETNQTQTSSVSSPDRIKTPQASIWKLPLTWTTAQKGATPGAVLTFTLPVEQDNDELWEIVQLWITFVEQTWRNRATPSSDIPQQSDERIILFNKLSGALLRVTAEMASQEVLVAACQTITETMSSVDHVGIVFNDNAPVSGTVVAEYPSTGAIGQPLQLEGYTVYEYFLRTKSPFVVNNVAEAFQELGPNRAVLMEYGIKSVLILPLVVQDELIGSIGMDAIENLHTFSPTEIEVMQLAAAQIAGSIYTSRLFEDVQFRISSQALMDQIIQQLSLRGDVNLLIKTAATDLGEFLGATTAHIHLSAEYFHQDNGAESRSETAKEE